MFRMRLLLLPVHIAHARPISLNIWVVRACFFYYRSEMKFFEKLAHFRLSRAICYDINTSIFSLQFVSSFFSLSAKLISHRVNLISSDCYARHPTVAHTQTHTRCPLTPILLASCFLCHSHYSPDLEIKLLKLMHAWLRAYKRCFY